MQFLSDGRKRGARASVANSNRGALLMAAELLFLKSVAILACNVSHPFQRNFKLLNYAKPFGY